MEEKLDERKRLGLVLTDKEWYQAGRLCTLPSSGFKTFPPNTMIPQVLLLAAEGVIDQIERREGSPEGTIKRDILRWEKECDMSEEMINALTKSKLTREDVDKAHKLFVVLTSRFWTLVETMMEEGYEFPRPKP